MNNIYKIFLPLIIFIFIFIFNSADFTNGIFIEGGATPLFITGFGGLSLPLSTGSFMVNPSLAAILFQDEGALLFGGFNNFLYISSYFNFITDYGNLSVFGSYIGNYSTINYILFKIAFSKMINESFYAGFDLNLYTINFTDYGFGVDFGITSINNEEIPVGFSFSRFSYAFVIKNLGLPVKIIMDNQTVSAPPIGFGAGANIVFLNISNIIYSQLFSDLYLYFYPLGFGLKTGLLFNILDYVNIVTAFNIGTKETSIMESAWFFLGISIKIPIEDNTIFASYSYIPTTSGGQHSISTSFAFGKIDTQPPVADLIIQSSSKRNAFSPNYDGNKDEINIKTKFSDNGIIAGWKIQIYNQENEIVKEFIGEDARKISYLTLKKILSRLFEKKKAVEIPEIIIWDGTDKNGVVVPDGIYKVVATIWDERYNQTESLPKYIVVDTKIESFEINAKSQIFSPNMDGNLDKLELNINFKDFEEFATCQIDVLDSSQNIVNTYTFEKDKIIDSNLNFIWDGLTNTGKVSAEGNYIFKVKYFDDAGNFIEKLSDKIKLVIDYEIIKLVLKSENQYFSSNKVSNKTELEFTIDISSTEDLQNLLIIIKDKDGKIIFTKEYKENIPKNFKWNGTNNEYKIVEDGIYSVIVVARYNSGNEPKSNEIIIIKDSILPQIEIKEQYLAFSPNDDGVQDTVTFLLKNDDTSKIVEIGIISEDGQKYLFPLDSIKNGKFIWDGKDSSGNDLKQGQYYLEVKAIDLAGNTGKIQSQKISLVKKAEEVSVNSDIYYYSPNNDNRNDIINFSCLAENSENVISMDLFIEDSKGKIVYSKNFKKFIQNIQFSEKLNEGQYFYYIKVFYNNGNSPISPKRSIIVDLTAPNIEITSENLYFTNKEPFSNMISFNYNISEKILSSTYSIVDQKKVKILEKNIEVEDGKIQWDGKKDDKALQEGEYNIIIISYDLAGNKSEKSFLFYLVQNTPKINLLSEYDTISPNNDNLFDETEITIVNDGTKTLDKLVSKKIIIKNYDNKIITSIEIPLNAGSFLFTGTKLEDGIYKISAILSYSSGIQDSAEIEIAVDKTPPKLDLVIKPELFSPDNDGEKDTLYITYSLNDFSEIESYTIRIYRLFEDGKKSVKPFKVFQVSKPYGKNIINQIQWDGKGDEPDTLVDSATDYQLVFTAVDKVGNEVNISQNFTVDILVMKTDLGYKIIINSIEFDLNSAVLKKSNYKILDLLIKKLLKFPDYKIIIIGFTDSTGDPNYNLILSERRAKAVYDYLIKNDIPKSRLEYKGMGVANPIDSNDNEEGRRRNRRVEFYLVKMNQ